MKLAVRVPVRIEGYLVRYLDVEDGVSPVDAMAAEAAEIAEAAGLAVSDWAVGIQNHALSFAGSVTIADHSETIDG